MFAHPTIFFFFFFNDTATTEIYTLSLHDALPILGSWIFFVFFAWLNNPFSALFWTSTTTSGLRSEEHTSELQSRSDLVCRLLLEKKKKNSAVMDTSNIQHIGFLPPEMTQPNIALL